jgi:hypothetical protein
MEDRNVIQSYVNNLRRHLARYLKPKTGMSVTVYPAEQEGAIVEIRLGPDIVNEDHYAPPQRTVNDALRGIKQRAFGGELAGFRFRGTNIIGEGDRLILIKGGDSRQEWSDDAAAADVRRIVTPMAAPEAP